MGIALYEVPWKNFDPQKYQQPTQDFIFYPISKEHMFLDLVLFYLPDLQNLLLLFLSLLLVAVPKHIGPEACSNSLIYYLYNSIILFIAKIIKKTQILNPKEENLIKYVGFWKNMCD